MNEARIEHAEHQSKIHHENATKHIESTCITFKGSRLLECIETAIKTSGEYQRAQKDLNAQSEMAQWAFALLVLSALGIGISGIGVYYVRDTLIATADAVQVANSTNKITEETAKNQLRAYVTFDGGNINLREGGRFSCTVFNHGTTPAKELTISIKTAFAKAHTPIKKINWGESKILPAFSLAPQQPSTRGHSGELTSKTNIQGLSHKEIWFYGSVVLKYTDIFGYRFKVKYIVTVEHPITIEQNSNGMIAVGLYFMSESSRSPKGIDKKTL